MKIRIWLISCAILVVIMIGLGGYTRLSHAGLSIVSWDLIIGVLPPLNASAWFKVFEAYKQFPEFQQVNSAITIEEFKFIYYIEWLHRFLGRILGAIIVIPWIWFWAKGHLNYKMQKAGFIMFILVSLQGGIGWYMVKSGLIKDPAVSPYRLALHLAAAFFLYGYILSHIFPKKNRTSNTNLIYFISVNCTILYGAFVAGHKAGLIYNDFPWMGQGLIPDEMHFLKPIWHNYLENPATIQFVHKILAVTSIVCAIFCRNKWILFTILLQFTLGIVTLMYQVPLTMGVLHQLNAVLVFSVAFYYLRKNAYAID